MSSGKENNFNPFLPLKSTLSYLICGSYLIRCPAAISYRFCCFILLRYVFSVYKVLYIRFAWCISIVLPYLGSHRTIWKIYYIVSLAKLIKTQNIDGAKYVCDNDRWVYLASGVETASILTVGWSASAGIGEATDSNPLESFNISAPNWCSAVMVDGVGSARLLNWKSG